MVLEAFTKSDNSLGQKNSEYSVHAGTGLVFGIIEHNTNTTWEITFWYFQRIKT